MKLLFEKIPQRGYFLAACIVNLIVIIFALLVQGRLPPEIPILYGLPQGESQLTKSIGILAPSLSSFILVFVNLILVNVINNDFAKKVLGFSGLITAIFAAITTVKTIFLIGQI